MPEKLITLYYCTRAPRESAQTVELGKQPTLEQINYAAGTVEDCENTGGCPDNCTFRLLRIEAPSN